ncbi:putative spermidine/putrescine transport system substrate-binding protein/mannopine transport system substrate-binding protein [Bradyrhizobium sp. CIR48]|uniref:ABC transporter substrate-binding protein n=1 Tax=Bradyrhizobium sp. CIR48 TaxID=2663840 RepID=UPI001606240D|nr:ABC transporter substrate-binding protein [Bradyrhizobium sp. CIR48]MBB4423936.1 putative spermidine/putrescine transport system substrate-binding protein/mannopine transport system substrate-binding protein [Bradyrhizobium sp. CIR48]
MSDLFKHPPSGFSRRSMLRAATAAMAVPALARSPVAFAQDKLAGSGQVIAFSWGGLFTKGIRKYVYEPFTEATGIKVVDVVADVAEPQVKAMNQAGRVDWDTAFIQASILPSMDEAGMFLPINYSLWDPESIRGTEQSVRLKSAVPVIASAMTLAYDKRALGNRGPKSWSDFWNVKAFSGPRGLTQLPANAKNNIVFALLADGVPKSDIWPLTDDKIDRALKKFDEIRPHITKWWTAGSEAPQLLLNREIAMSSCFDGRAISAIRQGAPIEMIWDGAYVNYTYWTVLKGGPNSENAQKLIAFVNRAAVAAGFTTGTGYPGPNINQLDHLPSDQVPLLSINPENSSKVIHEDSAWLAAKRPDGKTNLEHIGDRWLAWRVQ